MPRMQRRENFSDVLNTLIADGPHGESRLRKRPQLVVDRTVCYCYKTKGNGGKRKES